MFLPGPAMVSTSLLLGIVAVLVAAVAALLYLRSRKSSNFNIESGESGRSLTPSIAPERREVTGSKVRPPRAVKSPPINVPDRASFDISDLPIVRITDISSPSQIEQLPESTDEGLLAAIESLQEESETAADADAEMRLLALRVLAGFRTRNSIEALSQTAIYDLSTTMRAKAVSLLADLDHQTVFEPIVLSCADPSREVRAAGARALVKVTFDRADEWARFAVSEDKYLCRQVARAAVEAGLAERSFDRLTLRDDKAVYEAFALVYLLIKAGETAKLFEAVREHRDPKTRIALLHIIKVANVAEVIPDLSALIASEPMGSVVADKAREALLGITSMPVEV